MYELFVNEQTVVPCVSYVQFSDNATYDGQNLRYYDVSFLVKIYSYRIEELEDLSTEVDRLLAGKFKRSGGSEFLLGDIIVKNLYYTATIKETNNG